MFGIIRVLYVAQRVGERSAELLEMPLMLAVIYCSARYLMGRHSIHTLAQAAAMGLLALAGLLGLEFFVVLQWRGLTISQYLASRDAISFGAYLGSLSIYAALPAFLVASRSRRD